MVENSKNVKILNFRNSSFKTGSMPTKYQQYQVEIIKCLYINCKLIRKAIIFGLIQHFEANFLQRSLMVNAYLHFKESCPNKVSIEGRDVNPSLFPDMGSFIGITQDEAVIQNHSMKLQEKECTCTDIFRYS